MDFNELMKKGGQYMEGIQKGREMAIQNYDKILIELWDKLNDIEKKVDKLSDKITPLSRSGKNG